MELFIEILLGILSIVVVPIVLNKSDQHGHFDFLHGYLRETWAIILGLYWLCLMWIEKETFMAARTKFTGWKAYLAMAGIFAVVGCVIWALTGLFMRPTTKIEAAKEQIKESLSATPELSLKLDMLALPPILVPPNCTLYYARITMDPKQPQWGLASFSNSGEKSFPWYPQGVVPGQMGVNLIRCNVKNESSHTIVSANLKFSFSGRATESFPTYTVPINSLSAGDTFSFYFDNGSSSAVILVPPDKATNGLVAGETAPRDIAIHKAIINPLEAALGGALLSPHDQQKVISKPTGKKKGKP
jgi:hypothetical protein